MPDDVKVSERLKTVELWVSVKALKAVEEQEMNVQVSADLCTLKAAEEMNGGAERRKTSVWSSLKMLLISSESLYTFYTNKRVFNERFVRRFRLLIVTLPLNFDE